MAITKDVASAQQNEFDHSIKEINDLIHDSFSKKLRGRNLRMHNSNDPEDDNVNNVEASIFDADGKKTFIPTEPIGKVEIYPPIG